MLKRFFKNSQKLPLNKYFSCESVKIYNKNVRETFEASQDRVEKSVKNKGSEILNYYLKCLSELDLLDSRPYKATLWEISHHIDQYLTKDTPGILHTVTFQIFSWAEPRNPNPTFIELKNIDGRWETRDHKPSDDPGAFLM